MFLSFPFLSILFLFFFIFAGGGGGGVGGGSVEWAMMIWPHILDRKQNLTVKGTSNCLAQCQNLLLLTLKFS